MVHQRALFSSSSTLGLEVASSTGDSVDAFCTNSPEATSKEVLVFPSIGTIGEEENQLPGKNRDEVVDSSLLRVGVTEGSMLIGEAQAASTDGKWSNESLQKKLVCG